MSPSPYSDKENLEKEYKKLQALRKKIKQIEGKSAKGGKDSNKGADGTEPLPQCDS